MSTNDLPEMRDVMAAILDAQDVLSVWNVCANALQALGMMHMIYGASRVPTWGIIGDGQDALILHRGSQEYADAYIGEELYRNSPTYEWAENNSGFASWSEAVKQQRAPPSQEQVRIVELNIEHNCLAGFVGSLNDVVPGMRGAIGMSPGNGLLRADADALWEKVGADVALICRLTHLRIATLPQAPQHRPLTSRQREALTWCAQGKTMQDVATIMGLSIATIEKHLRMAREALGAQTTAHAVQKATSLNLLIAEI